MSQNENYPEKEEVTLPEEELDNEIEEARKTKGKKKKSVQREIIEWIVSIGVAILVALIIRNYFFTLVLVDGDSMKPTLQNGQRLAVSRFMYEPKDGDIIIFHPKNEPDKAYVKRVIATEGETVRIDYDTDTVYVNGLPIKEDYINEADMKYNYDAPNAAGTEVTVPEGCVFVMGDNRNHSMDSRTPKVDFVTKDSIIGKAQFRLWPMNAIGGIY